MGGLEQRQKVGETDSNKWKNLRNLSGNRVSAETLRPLPAAEPLHLVPREPYPLASLYFASVGGLAPPPPHNSLAADAAPPNSTGLHIPLYSCLLCSAKGFSLERGFSHVGGRGPDAKERLRLARGRGSRRCAGRTPPPKAGPENSQLERVEPGQRSWMGAGAGPDARGSQQRAGGALGCHKVNGRRLGVAVRGQLPSLPQRVQECRSRARPRLRGAAPTPAGCPAPGPCLPSRLRPPPALPGVCLLRDSL